MAGERRATKALTIRILGRDYAVACPENERESLLDSAEYLSKRMAAIKRSGRTLGNERIAIMAALNISRELLDLQRQDARRAAGMAGSEDEMRERLAQLQLRIDSALDGTR